jgi:hypothetical protein
MAYYNARASSIKTQAERLRAGFLTVIIDGMDQATTRIPHAPVGFVLGFQTVTDSETKTGPNDLKF